MITALIYIAVICVIAYAFVTLLPIPANVQKVIWVVVSLLCLLIILGVFGYGPGLSVVKG
jgi:hypothetical protein